ncbi:sugar-transfer associated ATP-grasp domain-containing protein [Sphingomonas arenae]|uniref:sugar-transfer associated ATP-grasp domain-containing protein n=2 Tax=Sphingomonas arenae TaxID=2812555 RepID=UPI00196878E8|nr:sugar-transfer associated ATP-grasp domain-containing protein [Sphingomonas arenae]
MRRYFREKVASPLDNRLWPLRVIPPLLKQTMLHAEVVKAETGMSRWQLLRDCWSTCMREQSWPAGYYRYRLFRPERRPFASRFIDERFGFPLLMKLNDPGDVAVLDDKLRFAQACSELGLAHVEVLAYIEDGQLVQASFAGPDDLPRRDLFVKSTSLRSGWGVQRWIYDPATDRYRNENLERTSAELIELIRNLSRGEEQTFVPQRPPFWRRWFSNEKVQEGGDARPYIIQPSMRNHARMSAFTNGALCTVRIVTARAKGGEPQVIVASLRMPTGTSSVDNFVAGGLASPVDLGTGTLGAAVYMDPRRADRDVHPDSGEPITGAVLPFWHEVQDLALRAHRAFPRIATVGWDIAITEEGVKLLEANTGWGFHVVQMAQGKPLGMTVLPELLMSHAD